MRSGDAGITMLNIFLIFKYCETSHEKYQLVNLNILQYAQYFN